MKQHSSINKLYLCSYKYLRTIVRPKEDDGGDNY